MSVVLLIGGSRDGDWAQVPNDHDVWRFAEGPRISTVRFPPPDSIGASSLVGTYKRMKWCAGKETVSVFAECHLTPEEVLLQLIQGYRPEEPRT